MFYNPMAHVGQAAAGFGDAMQGAMGQMWAVNQQNAAASMAQRQFGMEQARLQSQSQSQNRLAALLSQLFGQRNQGGPPMPAMPRIDTDASDVWSGRRPRAVTRLAGAPRAAGAPRLGATLAAMMGGEQGRADTMLDRAGRTVEGRLKLAAQQAYSNAALQGANLAGRNYGYENQYRLNAARMLGGMFG